MRTLLILLVLLPLSLSAKISDYVVKQWSTQDGLASQNIKSLVQDQAGYIWVATQFGLSRFDGSQFANFNQSNSDFLPSNHIHSLLVDSQGYLWIGTAKGLVRLNPETMQYQRFNVQGPVRDLVEDNQNGVWVAANGLYFISRSQLNQLRVDNLDNSTLISLRPIGQVAGSVSKMALSPSGLWLVNERNLLRLTKTSAPGVGYLTLELTAKVNLPERLAQSVVHDLAWLEGNLYVASELGAYFLDIDDELRPFNLPNANNAGVYKLMSDSNGALWVSTYGRLLFRDSSGEWQWVDASQFAQGQWISDILRDRQNNIWLASSSEGLWLAHTGRIERMPLANNELGFVNAITRTAAGVLWAATEQGVGYYDNANLFQLVISAKMLKRNRINDLHFVGERLYLATERGVLYYQNGVLTTVASQLLRNTPVFAITRSSQGGLWLATGRGLYRFGYNGLTPFAYNAFLSSKLVTFIDDKGNYGVLGTSKGAHVFSQNGIEKLGIGTSLENAYVTSITEIAKSRWLVGTLREGIFYNTPDGRWHQLDVTVGLPYGSILSLYKSTADDKLWVSTTKGVYRLTLSQFAEKITNLQVENVITAYDKQLNGQANQCCTGISSDAFAADDATIWYPSTKGVVQIPKSIRLFNDARLHAKVESIQTSSRLAYLTGTNTVLDTSERDITINYTAIDFAAPDSIEFRYQLSGLDTDWRYADGRRQAIYTNLPPGQYQFVLEAKRQGEEWGEAPSDSLTLTVPKRFDETMLFRLLLTGTGLLLLYLTFKVLQAQERRKQVALAKLVNERTQALQESKEKLEAVNAQLKRVSHSDELTGLRSRRFLFDQLPKDIENFQRNADSLKEQGKALVLVMLNLDKFAKINDAHGTLAGDSCLQQVSTLLMNASQSADYVVRWSGDEFIIVLRDFEVAKASDFARSIVTQLASQRFSLPNGQTVALTASVGWSCYPLPLLGGQIINWETSINLADLALNKVKFKGGNGLGHISFDDALDAFEFESTQDLDSQVARWQQAGLASDHIWMNASAEYLMTD